MHNLFPSQAPGCLQQLSEIFKSKSGDFSTLCVSTIMEQSPTQFYSESFKVVPQGHIISYQPFMKRSRLGHLALVEAKLTSLEDTTNDEDTLRIEFFKKKQKKNI